MTDTLSPQALSKLIGSIYDCALDPSRWEDTLGDIRDAFCCETAVLALTDIRHNKFLIYRTVGIEPYWLEQQAKHLPENHKLIEAFGTRPSIDEPNILLRHVPEAYRETSPYIQECLKPQGLVDIMEYILMRTPTRFAAFAVARHERQGFITEREIELGGLVLPHVRRAVTISNVLDARTIERSRMAEALDALRCAVVLTDARGAILYANSSAEHMLRDGGPLQAQAGILRAKVPAAAAELRSAIRQTAQDESGLGKTGLAIRLTEPDMPPIFAHVLPLIGGNLRTRLQPEAVAAVFIGTGDEHDGAETAAVAFGLTPAEARVLASLLAGRTLAETAAALGIASATAKTHLDHIFSKTGVARQADLMRLGARLVPPTRT